MVGEPKDNSSRELGDLTDLTNELLAVLNSAYTAIIAVDINGRIFFINKGAEKFVGPAEGVIGHEINQIIPESQIMEVVQSGQPQFGRKLRIGDKIVLTNRNPIIVDGKITGGVGAFLDITDLESASHQLQVVRELNSELNALIDSSADGLVITDANGILHRMNRAYKTMVGIPNGDDLSGQPVTELVKRGYLSDLVTTKVLTTGRPATMVQEIRDREILFTGTPVFDDSGRIVRVIANIRDLTELNAMRRQLHKVTQEAEQYLSELSRLKIKALEEGFIFNSPEMQRVLDLTLRVARVDTTLLITGESGVGKEIIARIIHEASMRSSQGFVKVNCGAFAPSLIESELFGYEEGAFTGANRKGKPGIFEMASGGTLFLDEIGELPLELQVKLLRVIQEKEITRLGGTKCIPVDARLITATNRNLGEMVESGKFRKDLFFRLNVVNIAIPPLRDHITDIPLLVDHFIHRFCQKFNLTRRVSGELIQAFVEYDWPGNIRELENTIERMVIMSPNEWLDRSLFAVPAGKSVNAVPIGSLKAALAETEKRVILQAFQLCGGTRKTAALLGINQSTVVRKLQQYRKEGEVMF